MTRSRDIADQQENLGGAVAPFVAGKNAVINGGFDIWQRGSFNSQTGSAYALDRWYAGVGGTATITQQTTGAPAGSQYCMRVAYNANSSYANQFQALESASASVLAGQTVTASILVRANATWVATANQGLIFVLEKNSTANTLIGGTWSTLGSTSVAASSMPTGTGSSNWYKLTVTCAVPNDGTAAGIRLRVGELQVGPSGGYWEMAQCQLEIGSQATPFSRAGGSIGGELALCQRYYWRTTGGDFVPHGLGFAVNTTTSVFNIQNPVTMRTAPTSVDYANVGVGLPGTGVYSITSLTIDRVTPNIASVATSGSSGITANRPYILQGVSGTTNFVGFSAEL